MQATEHHAFLFYQKKGALKIYSKLSNLWGQNDIPDCRDISVTHLVPVLTHVLLLHYKLSQTPYLWRERHHWLSGQSFLMLCL